MNYKLPAVTTASRRINAWKTIFLFSFALGCSVCSWSQAWVSRMAYTANADGAFCFAIGDTVYVGGGIGSKKMMAYDCVGNTWALKANLPGSSTDRSFATAFSINGKGYMCMGLDGSSLKKDVWEYDPATGAWTQKHNFPGDASDGLFCFIINNKAYLGCGEDGITTAQYNAVYVYDPVADVWTAKNNYPTSGVIYPFSFSINNMGYVTCGQQSAVVKTTYQYDPAADSWTPKADYAGNARQAGVAFVLNNTAYCGLGMDDTAFYNNFYTYNPDSNTWAAGITLPDSGRSFPCAAVVNNTAYAGIGWSYTTTDVYHKDWWQLSVPSMVSQINNPAAKLLCYPNPTTGIIHLRLPQNLPGLCSVYNMAGQTMLTMPLSESVDLSRLPPGSYVLEAQTAGQRFRSIVSLAIW